MQRHQIIGGLLGTILCEALLARRAGEKQTTPAEWREHAMKDTQNTMEAAKIRMRLLDQGQYDGKAIIGCSVAVIEIKGETSFHTIATYADDKYQDVTVVYHDSRKSGQEKAYNVHGLHAATAVAESIEDMINQEAMVAFEEEQKDKKATAEAAGTSEGQPA